MLFPHIPLLSLAFSLGSYVLITEVAAVYSLISVEIMFEGVERLLEGRETKRLLDLFVVSTLGLLVNLLGIESPGLTASLALAERVARCL